MHDKVELELVRRDSRIRLDAEGRWRHEDDVIRNARLVQLFDQSFLVDDEGDVRLVLGNEWCYVEADETAYFVRRARDLDDGRVMLVLNDGSEEVLDPSTIMFLDDGALYCRVKSERYPARMLRAAYHHVVHRLDIDEAGGYVWRAGDQAVAIEKIDAMPGVR